MEPPGVKQALSTKYLNVNVRICVTDANDAPDVAARWADAKFFAKVSVVKHAHSGPEKCFLAPLVGGNKMYMESHRVMVSVRRKLLHCLSCLFETPVRIADGTGLARAEVKAQYP